MAMKFKVRDKVRFKKDLEVGKRYGDIEYLWEMDKTKIYIVGCADTDGTFLIMTDLTLTKEKCFWVTPEMIELAEDTAPTITEHLIRGNKTIVKLSNGKVGIAQCSPEDKFDVYEGLRVATARAYGREVDEPKKKEPKFEVWDRVRYKGDEGDFGEGTIVEISNCEDSELPYLVMFDKSDSRFHDGGFAVKGPYPSRCWWCEAEQLEKI